MEDFLLLLLAIFSTLHSFLFPSSTFSATYALVPPLPSARVSCRLAHGLPNVFLL